MSPELAQVVVRGRCACCGRVLGKRKRADAQTCNKSCRQKLSRKRKRAREVSCEITTARRKSSPVLRATAIARAGFGDAQIAREKRVLVVGKIRGVGVLLG